MNDETVEPTDPKVVSFPIGRQLNVLMNKT